MMRTPHAAMAATCVVLGLCAGLVFGNRSGVDPGTGDFEMYVSPNVIVAGAPCEWVTIHTDEPFGRVDGVAVEVDGKAVDVARTFADSRGNIVVKLRFQDVLEEAGPGAAVIRLFLEVDDDVLTASDTVTVKD